MTSTPCPVHVFPVKSTYRVPEVRTVSTIMLRFIITSRQAACDTPSGCRLHLNLQPVEGTSQLFIFGVDDRRGKVTIYKAQLVKEIRAMTDSANGTHDSNAQRVGCAMDIQISYSIKITCLHSTYGPRHHRSSIVALRPAVRQRDSTILETLSIYCVRESNVSNVPLK